MIGKQCAVSDRQVPRALNGIANALCVPSRFCSKALSQKVKLPFAWNDAIHLCQSAKLSTQAAPLKLIPCFASAEFAQIQEDGSGCTSAAFFNVAIPADSCCARGPGPFICCLIHKEKEIDMKISWGKQDKSGCEISEAEHVPARRVRGT